MQYVTNVFDIYIIYDCDIHSGASSCVYRKNEERGRVNRESKIENENENEEKKKSSLLYGSCLVWTRTRPSPAAQESISQTRPPCECNKPWFCYTAVYSFEAYIRLFPVIEGAFFAKKRCRLLARRHLLGWVIAL